MNTLERRSVRRKDNDDGTFTIFVAIGEATVTQHFNPATGAVDCNCIDCKYSKNPRTPNVRDDRPRCKFIAALREELLAGVK